VNADAAGLKRLPQHVEHGGGELGRLSAGAEYNTYMDKLKRAAVYVRISKDREGRELGVDRQKQDCQQLAERLGYGVVIFEDNDVSASTLSTKVRPAFDDMMQRVEAGEFAAIIAYSNSRLTRRVVELSLLIDVARKTGVRVHTVVSGQHDLDTADGRATMLTIATWDQAEAERTSERIKRQKRQRAEQGEWHGGAAPFGYSAESKKLVPVESEVKLIEEAVRRLLEDREPLHSVVTDWNASKIPGGTEPKHTTRAGKHWRQSNLRAILSNRSLLGETKAGVRGWEPIIDQRTFDRLQALFADPARKVTHSPGVKGGKYTMGGGLTVCGNCGKPLISSMKRETLGREQITIGCLRRVHGPDPKNHPQVKRIRGGVEKWEDTGRVAIDHNLLEEYVFGKVMDMLEASPRWHQRLTEKDPNTSKRLDALDVQRGDLRQQRERAGTAFVAGIMSERDAKREVDRIDAELEALEKESSALLRQPILDGAMTPETLRHWRDWTPGRRRSFLKLLIARVEIGEWPEGTPRTSFRKKGETDAEFIERQHDRLIGVVEKRTKIVWQWE
jgi:DNA invertase Pin-like site-specific DNA recombinase